jgi:hypothetical protein
MLFSCISNVHVVLPAHFINAQTSIPVLNILVSDWPFKAISCVWFFMSGIVFSPAVVCDELFEQIYCFLFILMQFYLFLILDQSRSNFGARFLFQSTMIQCKVIILMKRYLIEFSDWPLGAMCHQVWCNESSVQVFLFWVKISVDRLVQCVIRSDAMSHQFRFFWFFIFWNSMDFYFLSSMYERRTEHTSKASKRTQFWWFPFSCAHLALGQCATWSTREPFSV